jgi:predicted MPP superfamily phosphohydrolase
MGMVDCLLFLAACVGHGAILTFTINWLFGQPIYHKLLNRLRKLAGVLLIAGPAAYLWYDPRLDLEARLTTFPAGTGETLLLGYLSACWVAGLVVAPAATLLRLVRRPPASLEREESEVLDVAAQLGAPPVGTGKKGWMATLPGNGVFEVEFTTLTVHRPTRPAAWRGLTVLQLSDLHLCDTLDRSFYAAVVERCLADGVPDVVAVTGDLVDSPDHHRWLVPLLGRLRWREAAFAILGNHDSWYDPGKVRRRLSRIGMTVLGNDWRSVSVRGEPLTVIGHEGPWFRPAPDLTDCPAEGFRLLLSHTPDNIPWARRHRVDLMLSGHNHGGQIRLPVIGSLFVPSAYSRRYDCGTFEEGPTLLHVNRGLAGKDPLRYNCRPQVTRIVLA